MILALFERFLPQYVTYLFSADLPPLQHHFLFTSDYLVCFITWSSLFLGQSVRSRSALLCRPLWIHAPPQSQAWGRDLKLHQICRQLVLNHPKSPSSRNWIFLQNCTVRVFLVSDHKVALMRRVRKLWRKSVWIKCTLSCPLLRHLNTFTKNWKPNLEKMF